jgi:streptomycin 6-kinase
MAESGSPPHDSIVPAALEHAARAYHGEVGGAWLDRLPHMIERACRRWGLRIERPYPDGEGSWKAAAVASDGTPVVVKLPIPGTSRHAAAGLRLWNGRGAVRLLADDEADGAMLLERCEPATPLTAVPTAEGVAIAGSVLKVLWRAVPSGHRFDPREQKLAEVADLIEARLAPTSPGLARGVIDAGVRVFRTLHETAPERLLLHGDFSWGNILRAERGWVAIDPEPVVGDAAYEVAYFITVLRDVDAYAIHVPPLAAALDLDERRVMRYVLAQAVRHFSWFVQDGDEANAELAALRAAGVHALLS